MRVSSFELRLLAAAVTLIVCCPGALAQTGACCDSTGACTSVAPGACTGTSVYQGNDTVCVPNSSCRGACCSTAGVCSLTTPGGCTGANTFLGVGSVCSPTTICNQYLGACCSNVGICTTTWRLAARERAPSAALAPPVQSIRASTNSARAAIHAACAR